MTKFKYQVIVAVLWLILPPPMLGYAAETEHLNALEQTSKLTVRGVVKDAQGNPLPGVTVLVEGTSTGASTNLNGEYELSCPSDAELSFSFIGYATQKLPVANRTMIDVTLQEDTQLVDEVIVIGYGTTTRRRAVGAVDQVKSEAISERSVANLSQALQGTSPSLVIQQRSNDPADNQLNINIRGIGTMNNNEPLIVIDGLVSDNASFNKLNPSDIESVSVLKDAGTAAIYGSRAANGVLLITTKKGQKNQAPVVQLSAMVGVQDPEVLYTPVEGWQNATLLNIAKANSGLAPEFTAEQIRDLKEHGNGTYYMDEIFHYSMTQKYLEGSKCRKQIYVCRKLYLLGSKDHDVPRTLCCWNIVSMEIIMNRRYCKLYSLFFATGDVGCSLSALRWMNMIFLYLTAFSVYQIIRLLHPTNVFGHAIF